MFLKRLDSIGFKSFAERIELEFVPGITAVVGPNGSGKSNIIDAIRWVLGEQSAKSLRGSKMEDVIFQGSETRKALNVAEVTLTLDNSKGELALPYQEISITRRVYRSGESEFYINKKACRLKDIIELFLDSGLGREAFSIISQGRVEEVLSSKPEQRRAIFEEAAGVLKYKQRKIKAEFKLTETEQNLSRVKDIFYEIEQQVEPLKQKAETAQLFLNKKERLKQEEISLMVTEIDQLHNKWQEVKEKLKTSQFTQIEHQAELSKFEKEIESKQIEVAKIDLNIEESQHELLKSTEELEQLQTKSQVLSVRSKHATENKERIQKILLQLNKNENDLKKEIADTTKILSDLIISKETLMNSITKLTDELSRNPEEITVQLEDLKSDYIEALNEQATNKNELKTITQQLELLKQKHIHSSDKLSKLKLDLNGYTEKLTAYQKEEQQVKYKLEKSETLIKETQKEFETIQNKIHTIDSEYQHVKSELDKAISRKDMLEEMKADFQGFFAGAKHVLQAKKSKKLENIHGAVIHLINVPAQYLQSIEVVLGGSSQHIITTDETSAREAITWLKKTNSGRATFLPLNAIKSRLIPKENLKKIESHDGYIGIAKDLVEYDSKFAQAIEHLMGNVVIAKTLKDANAIAKQLNNRYRIVTLSGDVVHPGGSMSGGAIKKNNQSLFTREKDLLEVKQQLIDLHDKKQEYEAMLTEQNNKSSKLTSKLEEFEKTYEVETEVYNKIKLELQDTQHQHALVRQEMRTYEMDEQQYIEEVANLDYRQKTQDDNRKKQEALILQLVDKIETLTNKRENYVSNMEIIRNQLHEEQLKLAKIDERKLNLDEQIERLKQQLNELNKQKQNQQLELESNVEIENTEIIQVQLTLDMTEKEMKKTAQTEKISELREKRFKQTQKMDYLSRESKEQIKIINQLANSIQENEIQVNRLDVQLDHYLEHLQTEYTMTYEKAVLDYPKCDDVKTAKLTVENIKTSIEQLGPVHVGAIDEYEEMNKRYEFLQEQQADLNEAKATLNEAIKEMDEEMEKLFYETFVAIQTHFTVVFKELFGGGYAELKLTDPDSLLDTGIDIIAEPPGKKLKHLSLLSGGERALTAIALLFAILRVRPVPFCILDEVEAALDEANVQRFARYLHQYSDETQFIVITHRKGTMEESDVLYGITMQESGVSRVVSVRLDDKHEILQVD